MTRHVEPYAHEKVVECHTLELRHPCKSFEKATELNMVVIFTMTLLWFTRDDYTENYSLNGKSEWWYLRRRPFDPAKLDIPAWQFKAQIRTSASPDTLIYRADAGRTCMEFGEVFSETSIKLTFIADVFKDCLTASQRDCDERCPPIPFKCDEHNWLAVMRQFTVLDEDGQPVNMKAIHAKAALNKLGQR